MVENKPKVKALRRALCEYGGTIMTVSSLEKESFHDFAQADNNFLPHILPHIQRHNPVELPYVFRFDAQENGGGHAGGLVGD